MSSFDKFYIPKKAGFGRLSPNMLGFVRFLSPEKVRFYEVLSLLSSCAGLLYISEKVNNSKHFYAFLVLSYRAIYNPVAGCSLLGR